MTEGANGCETTKFHRNLIINNLQSKHRQHRPKTNLFTPQKTWFWNAKVILLPPKSIAFSM